MKEAKFPPEDDQEHAPDKNKSKKKKHLRSVVTAAVLTVLAAVSALLSGEASNEAFILQSKASKQSTNVELHEVKKAVIDAFIAVSQASPSKITMAEISSQYEKDRERIQEKATELDKECQEAFAKNHLYSVALACFEIAIVLTSVSMVMESMPIYLVSVLGGLAGLVLLMMGYAR